MFRVQFQSYCTKQNVLKVVRHYKRFSGQVSVDSPIDLVVCDKRILELAEEIFTQVFKVLLISFEKLGQISCFLVSLNN